MRSLKDGPNLFGNSKLEDTPTFLGGNSINNCIKGLRVCIGQLSLITCPCNLRFWSLHTAQIICYGLPGSQDQIPVFLIHGFDETLIVAF